MQRKWRDLFVIPEQDLRRVCQMILEKTGVTPEDARILTDNALLAELRGVESHGVIRLLAIIKRIRKGLINLQPKITVKSQDTSFMVIDADNGLGPVMAIKALNLAVAKPKIQAAALWLPSTPTI